MAPWDLYGMGGRDVGETMQYLLQLEVTADDVLFRWRLRTWVGVRV